MHVTLTAAAVGHPVSFAHELDDGPRDRHRPAPGRHRAVPDLEPRSLGARARVARLGPHREGAVASESPYLAFLVALHVATAIALLVYFRDDWVAHHPRVLPHAAARARSRRPTSAWRGCSIVATIPAGLLGLAFEHELRTLFAKPLAAAIFLTVNGVHPARRRVACRRRIADGARARCRARRSERSRASPRRPAPRHARLQGGGASVGIAQIGALFAGISRSGITMVAGLVRGLDHEDAARFSFLLATPIILAAGVYKLPDLIGHLGNGIRGQVARRQHRRRRSPRSSSVRFLVRFFQTRNLCRSRSTASWPARSSMIRFA